MITELLRKNVIEKVKLTNDIEVHVKSLTAKQVAEIRETGSDTDLILKAVCDVNGNPVLTREDLDEFPQRTVNELVEACINVNLVGGKPREALRKN